MQAERSIAVLRGRWPLALVLFGATAAAVLGAGLSQPAQYTASASLLMDARPDPVAGPGAATPSAAVALAAQTEVVRSERVARRVAAELPEAARRAWRERWQASGAAATVAEEPWLLSEWGRRLELRPQRDSGVLGVGFRAESADEAAAMANAWVQASLAVALELRVEPARQYAGYFEQRSQAARAGLEAAQQRLVAFQREHGIVVADDRIDLEQTRLAELGSQLASLQQQRVDSGSRQRQADGRDAEALPEVLTNPAIAQLKAELGRTEAQLGQLATRLGESHPQLQALTAQRDEQRERLRAETRRVAGSAVVVDRINQQREAAARDALEAQRERVLALKTRRDEGQLLQREVEQARRAYDALQQRQAQAELEGGVTRAPMSLLSPATAPSRASAPRAPVLAGLATLLGLLVAAGGLGLAERRSRRLRTLDDITRDLGVPLLGSLAPASARGA
jgi:chain length determinant protein EpsF